MKEILRKFGKKKYKTIIFVYISFYFLAPIIGGFIFGVIVFEKFDLSKTYTLLPLLGLVLFIFVWFIWPKIIALPALPYPEVPPLPHFSNQAG